MKQDFKKRDINIGDYVVFSDSTYTTSIRCGIVVKETAKKVSVMTPSWNYPSIISKTAYALYVINCMQDDRLDLIKRMYEELNEIKTTDTGFSMLSQAKNFEFIEKLYNERN